ncbi:MAG TPA: ThiF family adenylyltransferase, partial [Magnetospirillaceae bacterium]|nr:ThiF family adenylyltransferase [Magnetospirillaceae bacterium]
KTDSALEKLTAFNPDVRIQAHPFRLDDKNAGPLAASYDLVLAAVDNREARRVINRACYGCGVPWIDGGVDGFFGMVSVYRPPAGPCYECLTRGVPELTGHVPMLLGAQPGTVGLLQVQEAFKLILGIGKPLAGRVLFYDAREPRFDIVEVPADPVCPVCRGSTA